MLGPTNPKQTYLGFDKVTNTAFGHDWDGYGTDYLEENHYKAQVTGWQSDFFDEFGVTLQNTCSRT